MKDFQCAWVQHNRGEPGRRPEPPIETERTRASSRWERARRGQVVSAGELVQSLLDGRTSLTAVQQRVLTVLDEQAGAEVVAHIASVGVSRGVLRIETEEPAVLYDLRLRWEERILRLVQRELPDLGVRRVRFALARAQGEAPTGR